MLSCLKFKFMEESHHKMAVICQETLRNPVHFRHLYQHPSPVAFRHPGCQLPLSCSYEHLTSFNLKSLVIIPENVVTRIHIGDAFGRCKQLKAEKILKIDAEDANFLLDTKIQLSSANLALLYVGTDVSHILCSQITLHMFVDSTLARNQ